MSAEPKWWRDAAWLLLPSGERWIHPQTRVEHVNGGVRLTDHRFGLTVSLDESWDASA